jgi:hypothetical protein
LKIRLVGILSLCFLIILGTVANPVAAQVRTVGVSVGDAFTYDVAFGWSSSDPNATIPTYYLLASEADWISSSVVDVSNTTVTVQQTMHFINGTDTTQFGVTDVDTGDGNVTFWVISAILGVNDSVYASGPYSAWRMNETVVRTYPDGIRNTNHVNITIEANMGSDYQYSSTNFYWDQLTGIVVESQAVVISRLAGFESNMTVQLAIVQSDLWVVPEFSTFVSVMTLVIMAVTIVFVSHTRRSVRTKVG